MKSCSMLFPDSKRLRREDDENQIRMTQRVRRLGFCRKYNYMTERFDKETDQDYEYDD
jgi:hypothetical protein